MNRLTRPATRVMARLTNNIDVIGMNTVHPSPSIRISPGSRPNQETSPGAVMSAPTRAIPISTTMSIRPNDTHKAKLPFRCDLFRAASAGSNASVRLCVVAGHPLVVVAGIPHGLPGRSYRGWHRRVGSSWRCRTGRPAMKTWQERPVTMTVAVCPLWTAPMVIE